MPNFNQLTNDAAIHAAALETAVPPPDGSGVIPEPGVARTASMAGVGNYIRFTAAGAVTFTIPKNSAVPIPVGSVIEFEQAGLGTVTVAAASGVTVNGRGGIVTTAGQFAVAAIKKVAPDTWTLTGDLA